MPISHIEESSIHYLESGEGKALVILHGLGNNSQSWRQQLGQLDDEFRVIAWDAPGYGESSAGYRFVAFSLSNLNQMDILSSISIPTLVMCGELDQVTQVSESRIFHELIPNSELAMVPNTGHLCYQEAPGVFNEYVTEFLLRQKAGKD